MNFLALTWSAAKSVYETITAPAQEQDQRAMDAYLSQAQSVAELEYRERQWMRAHS